MKPVNYRNFKLSLLNTKEYRHIYLLLFWPLFGIIFYSQELLIPMNFHTVYSPLDDLIPFCELFMIPYLFWFIFLVWVMVYGFFFDVPTFKKYMYFLMITYTITILIYFIYPTKQELRPQEFARDNFLVDIVRAYHGFDTNTNVCPSLHCMGSFTSAFAAIHSKRYSTLGWRIFFLGTAFLISASTVFVKQHSIIDVIWALVICFIVYPFVFLIKPSKRKAQ